MTRALLFFCSLYAAVGQSLEVEATFNAGARLSCGNETVFVDSFFLGLQGYQRPSEEQRRQLTNTKGPVLALATHAHPDHWEQSVLAELLAANPQAQFFGTAQTAALLAQQFPKQVQVLAPGGTARWGTLRLATFALPHSGERWKQLENSAFVITFCGKKIFHPGDAELRPEFFHPVGRVDVALLPYWYLDGKAGEAIVRKQLAPTEIWALHGDEDDLAWVERVQRAYPSAKIPLYFRQRAVR